MNYRIEAFGPKSPAPARILADLHTRMLPHSPVALLGKRFMERYYYRLLPHEGLIFGAVAYVDGKPAGFIVATHDSDGFMRTSIRRHWLALSWVMATSILMKPQRLGAVWEAWQIMRHLKAPVMQQEEGELLSFGVLPEYRRPKFVRQTGIRISSDLLDMAMSQIEKRGVSLVRVVIDADNREAQIFYHGIGWAMGRDSIPGWRTPSMEFLWPPDRAASV